MRPGSQLASWSDEAEHHVVVVIVVVVVDFLCNHHNDLLIQVDDSQVLIREDEIFSLEDLDILHVSHIRYHVLQSLTSSSHHQ